MVIEGSSIEFAQAIVNVWTDNLPPLLVGGEPAKLFGKCALGSRSGTQIRSLDRRGVCQDRLTDEQVALVKTPAATRDRPTASALQRAVVNALKLDQGEPPVAAKIHYFVEAWRELRHRKRKAG